MNATLIAPDIECDGCANSIKKALSKLQGVENVAVEVSTKTIHVTYEAPMTRENLVTTLDRVGFPVTLPTHSNS